MLRERSRTSVAWIDRDWLLAATHTEAAQVRGPAAFALGCAQCDAAARLGELAGDSDESVRMAAVLALGEDGSAAARLQLVRLLYAGDATLRPVAALALGVLAAGTDRADGDLASVLAGARTTAPELRLATPFGSSAPQSLHAHRDGAGFYSRAGETAKEMRVCGTLVDRPSGIGQEPRIQQILLEPLVVGNDDPCAADLCKGNDMGIIRAALRGELL